LLYCEGYRPEKNLAHNRTLQALPLILGTERQNDADYLEQCRAKRNIAEYDSVGQISSEEATELQAFAQELRSEILEETSPILPFLKTSVLAAQSTLTLPVRGRARTFLFAALGCPHLRLNTRPFSSEILFVAGGPPLPMERCL
jgi:hypothetical protein